MAVATRTGFVLTSALFFAAAQASAQETAPAPSLQLELNAVQPSDKGCRLTFVVGNRLAGHLERVAFELALFDRAGSVDRLAVLAFKDMPAGKTKVSRFDIAGLDCAGLGRVLVNEATDCVGVGVDPADCTRRLTTASKVGVEFGL